MKIFKTLLLIVTLIVLVVVGGVSYLITTFDANHYKKQIIEQVKTETGRDLSLPGDVNLKFFPSIALSIGEARLSSSEGFGDKDFAIIKKAKIAVELMPLLNRKLKIKEVQLDGLELDLLTKADGSTSWGDLTKSKSGNASASSQSALKKNSSKVVEDLLGSLSIAGLSLRDAIVHWHDIPKSQKISMTSLQLTTGVFKQGSPLDVSYSLQLLQHKPLLKLAAKGKTTVTLSQNNQYFSLENLILDFQASGDQIPNGQLDVVLEGDIAGSLKQVKASNLELQLSLNGDLVPEGVLKAHLTANADADLLLSKINLSGLSLKTDLSGNYVDGGKLEALLKGDAVIDLAKQLVTMPQLGLVASLKGGYAKGGQSSAHLQANTRFDIAENKLQLSAFKFTGDLAGKLLQGKGNIELEGETLAYVLDKETLLINGLQLKGGVNGELLNGEANTDLSSQTLSLDLHKKILKLTGLQLTGDIKGKVLDGGSANSRFASESLSYQLEKQELNIVALTGEVSTQDGLLKNGKAHSTVTTDLQFNVGQQLLKLSKLQLALEVDGELLSGMRTQTQLKGDLQLDLANYQVSSTHFDLQGKAAEGLLEQSKLSLQSKGHFDVSWKQETGSAALDILNVSIDDAEIKASQVKLSPLGGLPTLSGYFSTNVIQLRPLLQHFAIKLPAMNNPKALSTLRASFQLIADKKNIDLQKINIKLDDSTIQGHFSMQDFSNPLYKPELTIDKVNLDDYLAPKGESTQPMASSSMSTSATVQATDSSLFPIKALRALQLKGGIKIGSLYFNDLSFSHLVAKVNAHDGVIKLNPLQANLYKGVYKGHLTLNIQNSTPQITMHHVVDHLRSEGLLFDLFEDRYLSGQANLVTDLAARGDSVDALLASLSGKTQLSFKNGTIRDSKFAEKVSLAVNAFEKESVQDGQKVVKFTALTGEWQVNKGIFSTENLSLLSPYFSIEGQGEANIGSQTLDMLMRIGPKNKSEGKRLYAPLRVKGPFSDLSFSLDMKDLLKTLAQQDIEEAKRKLKEKVEAEKLKLQQKLVEEKQAARLKVDAEKERAKQRLTVEKEKYQLKWKAEQAQLKEKVEQAQVKAKQALQQKLSDESASQLKQKLGEDTTKKLKEKVEFSVGTEKLKEVEDKIKDKLKDKFKGLF